MFLEFLGIFQKFQDFFPFKFLIISGTPINKTTPPIRMNNKWQKMVMNIMGVWQPCSRFMVGGVVVIHATDMNEPASSVNQQRGECSVAKSFGKCHSCSFSGGEGQRRKMFFSLYNCRRWHVGVHNRRCKMFFLSQYLLEMACRQPQKCTTKHIQAAHWWCECGSILRAGRPA